MSLKDYYFWREELQNSTVWTALERPRPTSWKALRALVEAVEDDGTIEVDSDEEFWPPYGRTLELTTFGGMLLFSAGETQRARPPTQEWVTRGAGQFEFKRDSIQIRETKGAQDEVHGTFELHSGQERQRERRSPTREDERPGTGKRAKTVRVRTTNSGSSGLPDKWIETREDRVVRQTPQLRPVWCGTAEAHPSRGSTWASAASADLRMCGSTLRVSSCVYRPPLSPPTLSPLRTRFMFRSAGLLSTSGCAVIDHLHNNSTT
ncbi:hypothetical protein FB451DRAFT_1377715 [Mycena latifolia]|nr:hypothetical protein FB451DRAFT_1377715 [Mycena latifolia]